MIKSMTGFGRSKYEKDNREYTVEIKSVNHKYSDINVRMPHSISYLEEKVKREISTTVNRGKIDVNISFINNSQMGRKICINQELAGEYIKELEQLADKTGIIDDISVIAISKFPDVLNVKDEENEEIIWSELQVSLQEALLHFIEMRTKEGEKLAIDLKQRMQVIANKIMDISTFSTGLIQEYVVKLEARIKELLKTDVALDETRLAQEVVIYADKCSIEEEITRFKSHISQFLELLEKEEYMAVGKKLDFIIQEMNREINTIGSKANCLDITNLVIDVKTELENVREQIQNVE